MYKGLYFLKKEREMSGTEHAAKNTLEVKEIARRDGVRKNEVKGGGSLSKWQPLLPRHAG